MTEALLNEPQTPTDGQTAAQPDASKGAPAPTTESVKTPAPDKQQQPSADASKEAPKSPRPGLVTEAGDKQKATDTPAAPEKWELKNEGENKVAPGLMTAYEKAARDAGMKVGDAQKFLDTMRTASREHEQKALDALANQWADKLAAHPTLGGDRLEETLANGRKALAEFGSPELSELLLQTRLQYHPAVVELLNLVQRKVGGDRIVTGNPPKGDADDSPKGFYDRMPKG